MTKEAMRFLALNAVLHGHSALAGFEDNIENMAAALEVPVQETTELLEALDGLPRVEASHDPLTRTFLSFFRTQAYAFMSMGDSIVTLDKFMTSDLEGQVTDELRYMFLTHLIMDVAQGDQYIEPFISDGVLHCTSTDFQRVNEAIVEAYQLYMTGPAGTPRGLSQSLRRFTSLEHYSRISASALLKIFRQLVRAKKHPAVYQETMLVTSDLVSTYKHTGCIIAFRDMSHTGVNWLMDVEGAADSTMAMSVDLSTLRNYLVNDMHDLAGIKVARGMGDGGKILFPGVV